MIIRSLSIQSHDNLEVAVPGFLPVGARVSERRPPEFRTRAGPSTSTVNSVLGLPVVVVPYIKDHFLDLHILRLEASPPSRLPDSRLG